jgi:hypothetical protein
MNLPESVGCSFAVLGIVAGIITSIAFGFGIFGAILGGVAGFLVGWIAGFGLGYLPFFIMDRKKKAEPKEKKKEA